MAPRRARPPTPQPEAGATLTRPLRREDGRLDPTRPAVGARAPGPRVPAVARDRSSRPTDGRLVVWTARRRAGRTGRQPGRSSRRATASRSRRGRPPRACVEVQPAGGKPDDRGASCVAARPASSGSRRADASIGRVTDATRPRPAISGLDARRRSPPGSPSAAQPAYRARQVARRRLGAAAPIDSTRCPDAAGRAARRRSTTAFRFDTVADTELRVADGGLTEKALHRLADGALIESVLMHYPARPGSRERHTLCISSQAGCAVGCPFCATGELGFGRDLETAEIVDQVRLAARRLRRRRQAPHQHRVHGHGRAAAQPRPRARRRSRRSTTRRGSGSGARHITVSTSGVVPGIRRLTALGPQFTLAVSLHAARDPLRDVLVPLNRRWPVAEVVAAARDHAARDRPPDQLRGHDDRRRQRHRASTPTAMADLLRGDHAHVNLIPMNPVAHTPWTASPMPVIERFAADAPRGRHRDDDPPQPRPGDRRRLRPAGRGAGRGAAGSGRRPPARTARRRERGRPARRAQPRAGAGRGGGRSAWPTAGPGSPASILDADLSNLGLRRPARRRRRARTGSTSTSWTATSSRT